MFIKNWNIEEVTGYKPITTFYEDFSKADISGVKGIEDTYSTTFEEAKHDYKKLTELVLVLNAKIWEWCDVDSEKGSLYNFLWSETATWANLHLAGEKWNYYLDMMSI